MAGCRNAVVWVAASLQRLWATACKHPCLKPLGVHFIRHPCLTRTVRVRPPSTKKAGIRLFVIAEVWRGVEMRSFGSARPCADSVRPLSCILARPARCEFAPQHQKSRDMPIWAYPCFFGADGGGRTRTVLLPTDFESVTSANSITPANMFKFCTYISLTHFLNGFKRENHIILKI